MPELKSLSLLFASLLVLSACVEEVEHPVAPELTFVSISHTVVESASTPLTATIAYRDRQGDLGFSDPDMNALRVRDTRLEGYDWYHIQPLSPTEEQLDISGSFQVQLPPLFLLGNGDMETTTLTFQIVDRAENWSNVVSSPEIAIHDTL
jgi:hypothetical protein